MKQSKQKKEKKEKVVNAWAIIDLEPEKGKAPFFNAYERNIELNTIFNKKKEAVSFMLTFLKPYKSKIVKCKITYNK